MNIKNFEESKPNMLVLNITNLTEEQKLNLEEQSNFLMVNKIILGLW